MVYCKILPMLFILTLSRKFNHEGDYRIKELFDRNYSSNLGAWLGLNPDGT
jgi:hypothetical protein